jgi:regulator of sigma E protease
MNLIVAFVILYGLGVAQGESWMEPVVGEVVAGSGAADAGIAAGDRIVTFAGHDIETYADLQWEIPKHKGDTVTMEVERSGQLLRFADVLIQEDEDGLGRLGILASGDVGHRDIGFLRGFAYAAERTADTIVMIFQGIGMMFARDVPVTGPQGLAGVLGIVDISADFVKEGIESYLSFVVLISINLALLNMLPLLPLDGGHVVLSVVERIRRRPLSLRVFERISTVGLVLFVLLFLIAMYNDVTRIFTGW